MEFRALLLWILYARCEFILAVEPMYRQHVLVPTHYFLLKMFCVNLCWSASRSRFSFLACPQLHKHSTAVCLLYAPEDHEATTLVHSSIRRPREASYIGANCMRCYYSVQPTPSIPVSAVFFLRIADSKRAMVPRSLLLLGVVAPFVLGNDANALKSAAAQDANQQVSEKRGAARLLVP